jgi:hypothetical protein
VATPLHLRSGHSWRPCFGNDRQRGAHRRALGHSRAGLISRADTRAVGEVADCNAYCTLIAVPGAKGASGGQGLRCQGHPRRPSQQDIGPSFRGQVRIRPGALQATQRYRAHVPPLQMNRRPKRSACRLRHLHRAYCNRQMQTQICSCRLDVAIGKSCHSNLEYWIAALWIIPDLRQECFRRGICG